MKEQLANIRAQALAAFEAAQSAAELDSLRVQYLGKKGELTAVLKMMGKLSAEERPAMGQLANEVRAALEQALEAKGKELEAKALDIALLLHMEHGGGNNSTFTTRVVTSSGSDTYSTMAAALCSLKGPRHGGANIKVIEMIQDIKSHLHDWTDPEETSAYLRKLLNKEAFDHSGLIYGMGHAVYSISDPREQILRSFVNQLAVEKGRQDDLALYRNIEEEAPKLISKNRPIYKGVSANIDLYSGFLYDLLGIPVELYTPLFAIARIVGWSAHRIEELVCMNKIIRPAYMSVMRERG